MLDISKLNLPEKQLQIVRTALDLFQQFGIKRIPVEEICQAAGVSKMTFYKYYKNKSELVRFLWEKGFEQAFARFDAIREMDIPFEEKLQLILELKDETSANMSHQFALEYFFASPDLKGFFEELSQSSIKRFLDFLKEAQIKGEVRSDLKPEFIISIINNLQLLVKDEILMSSYASYHDFVMEINNFMFYGILPRPDSEKK